MKYVGERRYDGMDRISTAIFLAVLWGMFGTGSTGVIGEIIFCLWLAFCAEFSFEYHQGKLCIRAAGDRWILDGWLRLVIWPFAKPLSWLGIKNCPILAFLMTGFFLYVIAAGFQVLDTVVHIAILWLLYFMRKAER